MTKTIEIKTDFIKLDQLLKYAEITDSGGLSKMLITEGYVKVNGETCEARGKKIVSGDQVSVDIPDEDGYPEETILLSIVKKV